jgi:two-component system chemotaxis response regulator CheB
LSGIKKYEAIVIGVSAGGINALKSILYKLPGNFPYPVIIVQHLSANSDSAWITILDNNCKLKIKEADEKEQIEKGTVYIAPPNYHLLIEKNKTFSLTVDERVNFARPSIDVLFETAAEAYKDRLIGIILTGSSNDGTAGLKKIKEMGGLTIAQDPSTAESSYMPASAIASVPVDHILPLNGILDLLITEAAA